ncbi:AAA family ATPase [Sorangium sp. So ce542]|uniref:ATP-binding protein n=1 Tax=Sorangium sp. So ce542 TaxID=3133316 RepID=UPI003F5DFFB5
MPGLALVISRRAAYKDAMSTELPASGLRLTRLDVRDFRGIDEISLDLRDAQGAALDLVVLAGANGSGKTALLEAILLLLHRPDKLPRDAAPLREQIRFGAEALELRGEFRYPDRNRVVDFHTQLRFAHDTPASSGKFFRPRGDEPQQGALPGFGWSTYARLDANVEYFSARREPEALGEIVNPGGARSDVEGHRLRELKRRLISAYYRDLRAQARRGTPVAGAPANGEARTALGDGPFARLQRLWERFSGAGQTLDVIPVSNDPGSGDEVVLRDDRPIPEDVTSLEMARRLAPARPDIPRMVPLDRLSSGQVALFAFAGPLIFRDAPTDVMLIDEPEQHMHVQWQRLLVPALRELSPTTQLIVATHSEAILDSALSYERFILVEDEDPRAHLDERGDDGEAELPAANPPA